MITWTKEQLMETREGGTKAAYYREGACLSTDTKPTGEDMYNGSCLMEMDTCTLYMYDDEHDEWLEWGA